MPGRGARGGAREANPQLTLTLTRTLTLTSSTYSYTSNTNPRPIPTPTPNPSPTPTPKYTPNPNQAAPEKLQQRVAELDAEHLPSGMHEVLQHALQSPNLAPHALERYSRTASEPSPYP